MTSALGFKGVEMEVFIIVATVVGLIAGLIAISDKFRAHLFDNNKIKHIFESEYADWKNSGCAYVPSREVFLKIANYISNNKLDDERESFCVMLSIHYGDPIFHEIIKRNINNQHVYNILLKLTHKKGVRVGWRAEYALSTMNEELLEKTIEIGTPEHIKQETMHVILDRIKNKKIIPYLEELAIGNDQKQKNYATEVIGQIKE